MRIARRVRSFAVLCVLCTSAALGSCGDDPVSFAGGDGGTAAPGGANTVQYVTYEAGAAQVSYMAPVDGGFIYAAQIPTGAVVARFTNDLALVWQNELTMAPVQSLHIDTSGRVVLIGARTQSPSQIVRLTADGALDAAVESPASASFEDAVPLPSGGMMLGDGTLVSDTLEVVSRGDALGERIAATEDGYVVLTRDLLTVRKLDLTGALVWEHRVEIPAANYYPIGIRTLANGDIIAATSGDTNPGNVLIAARLDRDGNLLWITRPAFQGPDRDGFMVPLQFGAGIALAGDERATYASFVANSGGLGSDVRSTILARIANDTGEIDAATFGGGGVMLLGDRILTAANGNFLVTPVLDGTCVGAPMVTNAAVDITTTPSPRTGDRTPLAPYALSEATSVSLSPHSGTLTVGCQ